MTAESSSSDRSGTTTAHIGLVLGAGGVAGGAFHAGVLAALEESIGWDPRRADVIVGTSAGSITGATLRAGLSAADVLARATGTPVSAEGARLLRGVGSPISPPQRERGPGRQRPRADIAVTLARAAARPFSARPLALLAGLLPEGTIGTEFISESLASLHPGGWSGDALWICAVRQRDGRLVVFGRDLRPSVADAVAASCAIPSFFRPVEIDDEAYIDGGVHSPTNADVLGRDGRIDLVVVSSPMSHAGSVRRAGISPVRRWSRALLDAEAFRLRRRGAHVIAFQPTGEDSTVMGANAMDPRRRAAIARQARESTLRRLERHDTRERLAPLLAAAAAAR
ncbi:MAG: patatin-like phospholipase family protein [Acidimicrobiia bacterium]